MVKFLLFGTKEDCMMKRMLALLLCTSLALSLLPGCNTASAARELTAQEVYAANYDGSPELAEQVDAALSAFGLELLRDTRAAQEGSVLLSPLSVALALSMVIGALAQRSRLCMAGGIRDAVMFGDFKLLSGFVAIFLVALIGNLVTKQFHWGFQLQPIAHSSHVWNFLGMTLVGWGSVLLGGCPLRQLILAGSGNGDSTVTVFGMLAGAAAAHNFGLAGTADSTNAAGEFVRGGLSNTGKIAVVSGIVVCLAVSVLNLPKFVKKQEAK